MTPWWQTFFDPDYVRIWEGAEATGTAERQVAGLWTILALHTGSRVLDAPCGYGRIAQVLAGRGARVVGVDVSADMLAEAERRRGQIPTDQLRYIRHDLRTPLGETRFDVALNLFSSLGYGSEADDVAVLTTLRHALRPGGLLFIETNHRDRYVAHAALGRSNASRLPDGTLLLEEPRFDPVTGRVDTTWYWSGPAGAGSKTSSIRTYAVTELIRLVEAAGLRFRAAHRGCFPEPFGGDPAGIGVRLGLLAEREE